MSPKWLKKRYRYRVYMGQGTTVRGGVEAQSIEEAARAVARDHPGYRGFHIDEVR